MSYRTVAGAETWARANPTKAVGAGGPSWNGWCAALMFWAGGFDRSCDTATAGSYLSSVSSHLAVHAPRGAFHWWRMGSDGHVALDLDGGGTRLLMASAAVFNFGDALGTISWSRYAGAAYVGWSMDFVGQRLAAESSTPTVAPGGHSDGMLIQMLARRGGYQGPLDGLPGTNTWKGAQSMLRGFGYMGPIDGVPGVNTYRALQRLAQEGGYRGPVDGIPGPRTYEGLRNYLK